MLFFGNYFLLTSILEIKSNRSSHKRKTSEEKEAQLEASKNPSPSCLNYIFTMLLMELGDKCQLGGITLSIKYNGFIIAFGSFLVIAFTRESQYAIF
jgi:putative Ca2+/H+ antiporter (TMEM165/GDT1 family)